jgi:hypothetical protein
LPALLIGPEQRDALASLREWAAGAPVDMRTLRERIGTAEGKAAHVAHMTAQTIELPVGFLVTFSIEVGHPCGVARHMSVSSRAEGRLPLPDAIWMIAEELGFAGGLETCFVYPEELRGHGRAINVVQPVGTGAIGRG